MARPIPVANDRLELHGEWLEQARIHFGIVGGCDIITLVLRKCDMDYHSPSFSLTVKSHY